MSKIRYIDEYDNKGNIINRIPYEVPDEQLAEEAEVASLVKVNELIDGIKDVASAKVFLKRLCFRLTAKGYLP